PPPWRAQVSQFLRLVGTRARWLQLRPLPGDAVATLLTELVGGPPGARLLHHVGGAAGNPLFVRELAMALREEGSLQQLDGTVDLTGRPLPRSFQRLVLRRLSSIPQRTTTLLQLAS